LRGDYDKSKSYRNEAYQTMLDISGGTDQWRRNQHY